MDSRTRILWAFVMVEMYWQASAAIPPNTLVTSTGAYNVSEANVTLAFDFSIDSGNASKYLMFRIAVPGVYLQSFLLTVELNDTNSTLSTIFSEERSIFELDPPLTEGMYSITFESSATAPLDGTFDVVYMLSVVDAIPFAPGSNGSITLPLLKFGLTVVDYTFPNESDYNNFPIDDLVSLLVTSSYYDRVVLIVGRKGESYLNRLGVPGREGCETYYATLAELSPTNSTLFDALDKTCREVAPYGTLPPSRTELSWNPCFTSSGVWELRFTTDVTFPEPAADVHLLQLISPAGNSTATIADPDIDTSALVNITLSTQLVLGTARMFRLPGNVDQVLATRSVRASPVGVSGSFGVTVAVRAACDFTSAFIGASQTLVDSAVLFVGDSLQEVTNVYTHNAPTIAAGENLLIWVVAAPMASSREYTGFAVELDAYPVPAVCVNSTFPFIPAEYWQWVIRWDIYSESFVCVATTLEEFPECLSALREIYVWEEQSNIVECERCSGKEKPNEDQSACISNGDDDDDLISTALVVAVGIVGCFALSFVCLLVVFVVIITSNVLMGRVYAELQSSSEDEVDVLEDLGLRNVEESA